TVNSTRYGTWIRQRISSDFGTSSTRRARDRCAALFFRDGNRQDVVLSDAVLDRGNFGEYRDGDLRRRSTPDVKADGAVQPCDFLAAQVEFAQPLPTLGVVGARS